jgi:large subunit ribosomal protein L23
MGLFDRFTSQKGKAEEAGPKQGVVKSDQAKDAEQKVFAAVPSANDKSSKPVKDTTTKEKDEKKPKEVKKMTSAVKHDDTQQAYRVLLRPIVTEKSTRGGQMAQYSFEVANHATKNSVAQSVFHLYGHHPVSVNIVTLPGKAVRFGRHYGRTNKRKKAIVSLPAGKTIDIVSA